MTPSTILEKGPGPETSWAENPANPFNWPSSKRWMAILATSLVTFVTGLSSTAIATPGHAITQGFGLPDTEFPTSFWPITSWTMGAAIGPMIGMPLLENFGTRNGYLVTYGLFTIFLIPQAVAQNFTTLIATRAIAGVFGGVLQNAVEPFAADTFATEKERDLPLTIFILVYEAGVTLGPTWGAIFSLVHWRWVFYSLLIIFGAILPCLCVVIGETREPIILKKQQRQCDPQSYASNTAPINDSRSTSDSDLRVKSSSLKDRFYDAIARPLILLFTEPVVTVMTIWSAFCFALVFLCIQSTETVYTAHYNFNDRQIGLIQIALFVGEALGFLACLPQHAYYQRSGQRNKHNPGVPIPEARLVLSIPASFIGLSGGLFWYVAASTPSVHWIVPTLGLVLVGIGIMAIVTCIVMYVTDAYTTYAGSAVAAVALGENVLAAWLPLSTPRMYAQLGYQGAGCLLGAVALILSFAPVVLMWKGREIRARSTYMSAHG